MTAAVMPQKVGLGHVQCEAVIQNAFHILFVQMVIVRCAGCKERRGRHLLGIPDYDGINAACKRSDSFGGWQLRSFVKYNQIKGRSVGVKVLSDGDRAHQHAGGRALAADSGSVQTACGYLSRGRRF